MFFFLFFTFFLQIFKNKPILKHSLIITWSRYKLNVFFKENYFQSTSVEGRVYFCAQANLYYQVNKWKSAARCRTVPFTNIKKKKNLELRLKHLLHAIYANNKSDKDLLTNMFTPSLAIICIRQIRTSHQEKFNRLLEFHIFPGNHPIYRGNCCGFPCNHHACSMFIMVNILLFQGY